VLSLLTGLVLLAGLACTGDKPAPDPHDSDAAVSDSAETDTGGVTYPDVATESFEVEDSAAVPCASGDFDRPTGYAVQNLRADPFVVYAVLDDCSRIGDDLIKPGDTRSLLGYVGAAYVAVNQIEGVEVQYFILGNDEPTIVLEKVGNGAE